MAFTNAQPNDSASVPISAPYNTEGNTFPALAGEPGAYVDANSNQSSAALMSFLRPRIIPGQSASNKSSGSVASLAKAFPNNNVAGNSIVVCCGVGNGTAPTVTDSAGNTYTQIGQVANSTAFNVAIFLAVDIVAGANTVTVNNGGTTASIAMEIYEVFGFIGVAVAQPDQKITNTGSSGTASTSAIAASFPNEIAFAAIGVGTAAQTITSATGWTNDSGQQNPTTPAGLFSFISMSQFLGSQTPVTPQATFSSEPWAIVVATFKTVVVPVAGTVIANAGTNLNTSALALEAGHLATIDSVQGASGDANTVNSVMGRLTKIRDLLLGFVFDNTDKLRASLYVKTSVAGDTILALGQATKVNSLPVTWASDQGVPLPAGVGMIFKPIKSVSMTSGTPQAVWTPASGKKFRLMGYHLDISAASTHVLFEDATGSGNEFLRYPGTPTTNAGSVAQNLGPYGYLSSTANNALCLEPSTGTVTITGYVFGFEE